MDHDIFISHRWLGSDSHKQLEVVGILDTAQRACSPKSVTIKRKEPKVDRVKIPAELLISFNSEHSYQLLAIDFLLFSCLRIGTY